MFSLLAIASYAMGATPVEVEEGGIPVDVDVTCVVNAASPVAPTRPASVTVWANHPLRLVGPSEVKLEDKTLSFKAKVELRAGEAYTFGPLEEAVTVKDRWPSRYTCTAQPVMLRPRKPNVEFLIGAGHAPLVPGQPLFTQFRVTHDHGLKEAAVTLGPVLLREGEQCVAGAPPPLGERLIVPVAASGLKLREECGRVDGSPYIVLTITQDEPNSTVSAESFNQIIREIRLRPTERWPVGQMVKVEVKVTDKNGRYAMTDARVLPVSATAVTSEDDVKPSEEISLDEEGSKERLSIECTVPKGMIQSTKDLRVTLSAEEPIELESKELVKAKTANTEVVTFDVGARWSIAHSTPAQRLEVSAVAIDSEYAGTSCEPVKVAVKPKPPSFYAAAGGGDAQSFQPGEALLSQVTITDEDDLIDSAKVVLRFSTRGDASKSEVYDALVAQSVLSNPGGGSVVVHFEPPSLSSGWPELELNLSGRADAASYEKVLSSLLVSSDLVLSGVKGVDVQINLVDADGETTQWAISMPSMARQVNVYPQSVVRLRLIEYPRDGALEPGQLAVVQNEYVFTRSRDGVEKILVQALVENDAFAASDKRSQEASPILYVDVSVVSPGEAPDWTNATREAMPRSSDDLDCGRASEEPCKGWSAAASVSFVGDVDSKTIPPNTPIERHVYVRLQLADGTFQVIGPRAVSATWWDNAPLYEFSIASRPGSFGVTHVYCQDIIDAGDTSSMTAICENTPFDEYWTTGLNAAPVSLHARMIPFAKFPVFGLSADMALTILSNNQQVIGYDASLGTSGDTLLSEQNGLDGQFQASLGMDLRLPLNDRPIDVMFYVGAYHRDVGGASRLRSTVGVALIAPILIADQNDVDRARFKLQPPPSDDAEVADVQ